MNGWMGENLIGWGWPWRSRLRCRPLMDIWIPKNLDPLDLKTLDLLTLRNRTYGSR
ncbi:MAG: hypothetical protein Fur0042_29420 [Cyanophyceae cyanobacterium]